MPSKRKSPYKIKDAGRQNYWISPAGDPLYCGGMWHHEYLCSVPGLLEKYKLTVAPFKGGDETGPREAALRAGFVRVVFSASTGTLYVEGCRKHWRRIKHAVEGFQTHNNLWKIHVELFDESVKTIVDALSANLFQGEELPEPR